MRMNYSNMLHENYGKHATEKKNIIHENKENVFCNQKINMLSEYKKTYV